LFITTDELKYVLVCVIAWIHTTASSSTAGSCACHQLTSEIQCFARWTY